MQRPGHQIVEPFNPHDIVADCYSVFKPALGFDAADHNDCLRLPLRSMNSGIGLASIDLTEQGVSGSLPWWRVIPGKNRNQIRNDLCIPRFMA